MENLPIKETIILILLILVALGLIKFAYNKAFTKQEVKEDKKIEKIED